MNETAKSNFYAKVFWIIFIIFTLFWLYLQVIIPHENFYHRLFGAIYGVMALIGAIYGVNISRKWGGLKSIIGKALFMFSIGLFAQEFGQIVYSFNDYVLHKPGLYPSLGDLGYFGSIPLYIY